jgi:hypothetical protein
MPMLEDLSLPDRRHSPGGGVRVADVAIYPGWNQRGTLFADELRYESLVDGLGEPGEVAVGSMVLTGPFVMSSGFITMSSVPGD